MSNSILSITHISVLSGCVLPLRVIHEKKNAPDSEYASTKGSPLDRWARKLLSWRRESHQPRVWAILKVPYIHRRRARLDTKLTPAVCNFFHSAGVLQSKEPGVSKALSPSPVGAASQTNSRAPGPENSDASEKKKGTFIQRGSYLHLLKFDMVLFLYILMWFIYQIKKIQQNIFAYIKSQGRFLCTF